ncbi:MAG TPA: hypothetical protein VM511_10590, partial [Luteolibacter sp.]|nr:hypothetical protein [Luteolibacter sp.]
MEKDQLGFSCPRCGIDLVLPLSAAGVEGPCPRCGSVIRAPKIIDPEPLPPVEEPVRLEVSPEAHLPRAKPLPSFQPASAQYLEPVAGAKPTSGSWRAAAWISGALVVMIGCLAAVGIAKRAPEKKKVAAHAVAAVVKKEEAAKEPAINPALDPRIPPEGLDVTSVITRSAEVLGRFLAAQSLEERLPLMETTTPREELERSVLAKGLAVFSSFDSTEVRFNKMEGATDVAFVVPFSRHLGREERHLLMVRTRGSQDPKVVAEPFLDGFGGRVAEFAEKPVEGEKVFRVVMTVFDFCTDEEVPDREGKFTMKICAHPGGA